MKVTVHWQRDAAFMGCSEAGHSVLMDGPAEGGGQDRGPRPMEMLLMGMGACSSYDVLSILRKSRQAVSACAVSIDAVRAEKEPKVFTKIHLHFLLTGHDLQEKQVQRAIRLSAEKYCSASIMLGATADVTYEYQLKEAIEQ